MKKSDSGDLPGRKVPPQKPKRSPSTQLSFDTHPHRLQPSATPLPFQSGESAGDDEPVYIEMVGQVFTRDTSGAPTPSATTPDSDSDPGEEAIYEEMKYPVADNAHHRRLPPKHERSKSSKSVSTSTASALPRPALSSPSCPLSSSKSKSAVSVSHSSPLPSSSCSASSTPVPQPLSASPHPPRAPTPFLLPGTKSESEIGSSKIPAPFPNLLQHKPPLLAFPPPKSGSSKLDGNNGQSPSSLPPSISTSAKEDKSTDKEREKDRKDGPAPGLRARSHSTPLPPSSKSSSPYSHHHHHHHPHHRPSHYHHYRKPDKEGKSLQGGSQSSAHTQTQAKEGKSVSFLLKSDKSDRERDREKERDREREKERDRDRDRDTPVIQSDMASSGTSTSATPSSSSLSQRPPSRSIHRSHTPHSHLPAYKPPPSDSPLLWTYPSTGFRRPPAYDSLRAGTPMPSLQAEGTSKSTGGTQVQHSKAGFLPWDATGSGLGMAEDQAYWPLHRKLSFSHGRRETESKTPE